MTSNSPVRILRSSLTLSFLALTFVAIGCGKNENGDSSPAPATAVEKAQKTPADLFNFDGLYRVTKITCPDGKGVGDLNNLLELGILRLAYRFEGTRSRFMTEFASPSEGSNVPTELVFCAFTIDSDIVKSVTSDGRQVFTDKFKSAGLSADCDPSLKSLVEEQLNYTTTVTSKTEAAEDVSGNHSTTEVTPQTDGIILTPHLSKDAISILRASKSSSEEAGLCAGDISPSLTLRKIQTEAK